ncbi:hypothetical protein ACIF9R_23160 [Streptomyces sp. NPDC086080]|uniref:hypothetical protein n=1 Tax=Streptomyces sp. NPDC086080 TaxID=3365748 RepID=UPI0037CDA070
MTTEISVTPRTRRPETGWARARRLRGKAPLRTCRPAVAPTITSTVPDTGAEGNIVRGED